jgi:8-oxo-dGTP pyrophosphatase MutT (NUDIX family)
MSAKPDRRAVGRERVADLRPRNRLTTRKSGFRANQQAPRAALRPGNIGSLETMTAPSPVLRQAGVIPYRVVNGEVQVLLVTSRETRRWIIPKGNVAAKSTAAQAAEEEAFEEAGIKGSIDSQIPLGSYTYRKRLKSGRAQPAVVEVYLLRTVRQLRKWAEKGQRKLDWVSIKQAIAQHGEPGLGPLLDRLLELEHILVRGG